MVYESGMDDSWRAPIQELAARLRTLHAALVAIERDAYERRQGPLTSAQLLHLLMNDPAFAWLRPMSMLMADVDALLDRATIDEEDAAAVRLELDRLLTTTPAFSIEYLARLQQSPTLAVDHGRVREAMSRLPLARAENQADLLHRRHKWAEHWKHKKRS
jgi:hypothetical protein